MMEADFKCCTWFNCMPLCRPQVRVVDGNRKGLGSAASKYHPCCCVTQFTVHDAVQERFKLEEDLHLCARCLCCGAQSRELCGIRCYTPSTFRVLSTSDANQVGTAEHEPGRSNECDSYRLKFPNGVSVNDKLLLLAGVVCLDQKLYSAPKTKKMKD